jgi:hypothetical protein
MGIVAGDIGAGMADGTSRAPSRAEMQFYLDKVKAESDGGCDSCRMAWFLKWLLLQRGALNAHRSCRARRPSIASSHAIAQRVRRLWYRRRGARDHWRWR